jgi:hypothetical protein
MPAVTADSAKPEFLLEYYGVPEVLQTATFIHARKAGVNTAASIIPRMPRGIIRMLLQQQ